MFIKRCLYCKNNFDVYNCRKDYAKYCNRQCYNNDNPNRINPFSRVDVKQIIKQKHWSRNNNRDEVIQKLILTKIGRKRPDVSERNKILKPLQINEKNGRWNGGNKQGYSNVWKEKFKETIRKRDDYNCQNCMINQINLNRKLNIHHIDYNKQNCNEWNLISLCTSCHTKTNGNRDWWLFATAVYMDVKYGYIRNFK